MRLLSLLACLIAFQTAGAKKCPGQSHSNFFSCSSDVVTRQLNVFWAIYGSCEEKLDTNDNGFGDNPAWAEWDALKFSWNNDQGFRDHAKNTLFRFPINGINGTKGEMSSGFLWSWLDSERWPDQTPSHGNLGSFHFDQLPRFAIAIYQYYVWTGDRAFLENIYPRLDAVMNYLLNEMNGTEGIPINRFNNGLANQSRPSTYMDQMRSGWKDTWIATIYFTTLSNIIELESVLGNEEKRQFYQAVQERLLQLFDQTFWNETNGRYIGWRDEQDLPHDSGYVFINLEILARGLGDPAKADRIFHWLKQPADAILIGPHTGSRDIYHNVVAIRSNTEQIPTGDWDGWSDPTEGRRPYGGLVENGGTMVWVAYYDIMARLRYSSVDDAWTVLQTMLQRVDNDSFCLTFNYEKGRPKDDFGEDFVQIGSNFPFPESGIALLSFLHGFLGVTPNVTGLNICPKLPSVLNAIQVQVNYLQMILTIGVTRMNTTSDYRITIPEKQLIVDLTLGHCYFLSDAIDGGRV